jgi:hypothetical protein
MGNCATASAHRNFDNSSNAAQLKLDKFGTLMLSYAEDGLLRLAMGRAFSFGHRTMP